MMILWERHFLILSQGVDLLIADGEYTQEEYETRVGWGPLLYAGFD